MTDSKNNRLRYPRGTIMMGTIEADELETALCWLSDTLRGLTERDIGIAEPLHVGALGLCKNTVSGLLKICERWDRSDATDQPKPMTVTEALDAMSEAEPVKPAPVQAKPEADAAEAARMHHARTMSKIEDGLIRLGMIHDLVSYLSDAEGQGMTDGRGSTWTPRPCRAGRTTNRHSGATPKR